MTRRLHPLSSVLISTFPCRCFLRLLFRPFFIFVRSPRPTPVLVTVPTGAPLRRWRSAWKRPALSPMPASSSCWRTCAATVRRPQAGEYGFAEPATPGERSRSADCRRRAASALYHPRGADPAGNRRASGSGRDRPGRRKSYGWRGPPNFIAGLEIEAASLEGYLFPETYQFVTGIAAGDPAARHGAPVSRAIFPPDILAAAQERGA